jgi:hypothetical protein
MFSVYLQTKLFRFRSQSRLVRNRQLLEPFRCLVVAVRRSRRQTGCILDWIFEKGPALMSFRSRGRCICSFCDNHSRSITAFNPSILKMDINVERSRSAARKETRVFLRPARSLGAPHPSLRSGRSTARSWSLTATEVLMASGGFSSELTESSIVSSRLTSGNDDVSLLRKSQAMDSFGIECDVAKLGASHVRVR